MSGIGYVCEYKKKGLVQDDFRQGNSLNGVTKHDCGPSTRIEITKVKYTTTITLVDSKNTIKYDEFFRNKVGNDKSWK